MKIISAFKYKGPFNNDLYKVDLSIGYQIQIHGSFTPEQDDKFKFRDLRELTEEQARSVVGLGNALYEMGYLQAKRELAEKLGLIRLL